MIRGVSILVLMYFLVLFDYTIIETVSKDDFTNNYENNQKAQECSNYELSYFSLQTISIKELTNNELTSTQKEYIKKYQDILVCDGVISDISLYIITKRIDSVPSNIIALFRENGWSVRIVDYPLEEIHLGTDNNFTALTDTYNKIIWVENTNHALANSTCHEFGHFVDYMSGLTSCSNEFKSIYDNEKYLFTDSTRQVVDYAISTPSEYFASVFSEYCISKSLGSAYQSFSWVDSIVKNFN